MTSFYELLKDHGPLDTLELTYDHHVRKPVYVARTFLNRVPIGIGKDAVLRNAIDDALTDDRETLNTPRIPRMGKIADWLREEPGRAYVIATRNTSDIQNVRSIYTATLITVFDTGSVPVDYERPLLD